MARLPYAAKVLADQVREHLHRKPDSRAGLATMEPEGDPDGLGVYRTVKFDKKASEFLRDGLVLETLEDNRIADMEMKDSRLHVTFTHRVIADNRNPFPLDAARAVTEQEETPPVE